MSERPFTLKEHTLDMMQADALHTHIQITHKQNRKETENTKINQTQQQHIRAHELWVADRSVIPPTARAMHAYTRRTDNLVVIDGGRTTGGSIKSRLRQ
jgi:hypothetical protein